MKISPLNDCLTISIAPWPFSLHVSFHCCFVCLRVKDRTVRVPPGYQAELVIQLLWADGEPPQQITSLDINSAYGL